MFNIVLVHPEIPPNTGNIIRQCAVSGARLHLVEPVAFRMDERSLVRAGLDYFEYATVQRHESFAALTEFDSFDVSRCFGFTARATRSYHEVAFAPGDWLMFGNEARGLPEDVVDTLAPENRVRIPMLPDRRSLNLANAVCIGLYEAWRQQDFAH